MAIQQKEYGVAFGQREPNWELYVPPQGRGQGQGEFISVMKGGAFRFSTQAYGGLFSHAERIAVYLDRRSGLIGFAPAREEEKSFKVSKGNSFSAKALIEELGIEQGRYALRLMGNVFGFDPTEDKLS